MFFFFNFLVLHVSILNSAFVPSRRFTHCYYVSVHVQNLKRAAVELMHATAHVKLRRTTKINSCSKLKRTLYIYLHCCYYSSLHFRPHPRLSHV